MRLFVLGFLLVCALIVSLAGFRGDLGSRPPIEVFSDMDRQPKLRPQDEFDFFPDQRSSRLPAPGTIERSEPYEGLTGPEGGEVFPYEDAPVNTGRIAGTTNYVEAGPFPTTREFLARGRERYHINCWPCHGPIGDGNGVTKALGMGVVANLHDERIVRMSDGEMFDVITNGKNLMGEYGSRVTVRDRWAIIAYVRALQLSRIATADDVPENVRATLE